MAAVCSKMNWSDSLFFYFFFLTFFPFRVSSSFFIASLSSSFLSFFLVGSLSFCSSVLSPIILSSLLPFSYIHYFFLPFSRLKEIHIRPNQIKYFVFSQTMIKRIPSTIFRNIFAVCALYIVFIVMFLYCYLLLSGVISVHYTPSLSSAI